MLNSTKTVSIIGGGASGLICAIFCAKKSLKVDVYEQNSKCAKKILASGNGRCNVSNKNLSKDDYFSKNPQFVEYALREFGYEEFKKFSQSIGLLLDEKDDGRVYPLSNEAKSVASTLINYAKSLGVNFYTDTKITDIKALFKKYDSVVVATGSCAAPHLGGGDDGIKFAKELGHRIIPTYPSLVQLHLASLTPKKMSGVRVDAIVTLYIDGKKEQSISGDVLFSDYGVSGFAILDISQSASLALLEKRKVEISLNLLSGFDIQKLSSHIQKIASSIKNFTILDILNSIVPSKVAQTLLDELKIPSSITSDEITVKVAKNIANTLLNWRFLVSDTHGFRHAEVAGGGVDTTEVNPKTYESLKQKNLYFCGEVLDVVGKRGGYNFAFAWASGYLAAKDITTK